MPFLPDISQYREPLKDFIISSVDAKGAKHLKLEAANLISPHFSDEETGIKRSKDNWKKRLLNLG